MKYMLDTNICIYAQKNIGNIITNIKEHLNDGLAISAITLAELEYGVKNSKSPDKNLIALLRFLTLVDTLPFDSSAAEQYGIINTDLRKKGTPIGNMDTLIAAHAIAEGLTVVTHNTREFERVEGIKLEDWY